LLWKKSPSTRVVGVEPSESMLAITVPSGSQFAKALVVASGDQTGLFANSTRKSRSPGAMLSLAS
jgi:hypothetical protein